MKPKGHTWKQYIRNGLGLKMSKVGERLGIDAWTYNAVILELFHSIALKNAPKVVPAILECLPEVSSAIDVGCGSGAFAAEFERSGIHTIGLEHSPHGVALAREQGVDSRPFDVTLPVESQIGERADLVYSFEVAEHIPESLADAFVNFMVSLGDLVVFAAAQPGQGGIGHINEQPVSYWTRKFWKSGFDFMESESERLRSEFRKRDASDWFSNNTCIFRKQS